MGLVGPRWSLGALAQAAGYPGPHVLKSPRTHGTQAELGCSGCGIFETSCPRELKDP